jgi:hypothetical protein
MRKLAELKGGSQVYRHYGFEIVFGELFGRHAPIHPRAVHEYIDSAEFFNGVSDEVSGPIPFTKVRSKTLGSAPFGFYESARLGDSVRLRAVDSHRSSRSREADRDGPPDTAASTGNQRRFTIQRKQTMNYPGIHM